MTIHHAFTMDPGVKYHGHAKLALEVLGGMMRFTFLRGGRRAPDRAWLLGELAELKREGGSYAVEVMVGGRFRGRKTAWLNDTAEMQGLLCAIGAEAGVEVLRIPAGDGPKPPKRRGLGKRRKPAPPPPARVMGWRGELCSDSRASDAQIAIVVEAIVGNICNLNERDREHVYDAIGLACVALARKVGMRIRLPPAVVQKLYLQQEKEKAERRTKAAKKKAAEALGGTLARPTHVVPRGESMRAARRLH